MAGFNLFPGMGNFFAGLGQTGIPGGPLGFLPGGLPPQGPIPLGGTPGFMGGAPGGLPISMIPSGGAAVSPVAAPSTQVAGAATPPRAATSFVGMLQANQKAPGSFSFRELLGTPEGKKAALGSLARLLGAAAPPGSPGARIAKTGSEEVERGQIAQATVARANQNIESQSAAIARALAAPSSLALGGLQGQQGGFTPELLELLMTYVEPQEGAQ